MTVIADDVEDFSPADSASNTGPDSGRMAAESKSSSMPWTTAPHPGGWTACAGHGAPDFVAASPPWSRNGASLVDRTPMTRLARSTASSNALGTPVLRSLPVARSRTSRATTVVVGIVAIAFAWGVSASSSIFEYLTPVLVLFGTPIFALFLLGVFTRRVDGRSALIGGIVGYALPQMLVCQRALFELSNEWLGTALDPRWTLAFVWPPVFASG
jgi:hypothetical protein